MFPLKKLQIIKHLTRFDGIQTFLLKTHNFLVQIQLPSEYGTHIFGTNLIIHANLIRPDVLREKEIDVMRP